jgi:hypothetical protein
VVALATLTPTGCLATGEAYLQTTYNVQDQGTFTGFHIHPGAAGTTGPAIIGATLPPNDPIDSSGSGIVGPFPVEINLSNAVQVQTFTNLFLNPAGDYINIHTDMHPSGVMRAQLHPPTTWPSLW